MPLHSVIISLLSACALCACHGRRQAPDMLRFAYHTQGMASHGVGYLVERVAGGARVTVTRHAPPFVVEVDDAIFADLQAIADRHRVWRYRPSYTPAVQVSDGQMWSLDIGYADRRLDIRSGGDNAWPRRGGEALAEFRAYFDARFPQPE